MVARKRLSPEAQIPDEPDDPAFPEVDIDDEGRGPGRPSVYQTKYAKMAKFLCARGARDADLADAFSVTTTTIQNWMSRYPEFGKAVREGKSEIFDPLVERALAQRALGYSVDTEEVKITKDGDEVRYQVRKHYPPDTTAAIFWLKNRQPTKWRDVWKIDHEVKTDNEGVTAADVLDEIRKEAAELGLLGQLGALGVAPAPKANGKGNGTKH